MKAKSIKGKSTKEMQDAIEQSLSDGFKPTLAIVFLSIAQDSKAITQILDAKNISVFGVTSNGEFIDENTEKESTAILLLNIKREHFKIYLEEYPEKNYRKIAKNIAVKAKEDFEKPAFLIAASHLETDAEQLLFGFEDIIGKHVNVFGGMAGDD